MKILVYSEKKSDGVDIAKALSIDNNIILNIGSASINGFDGNDITVFWGAGHFYGLKTPKDYNIDYSLHTLPILPSRLDYMEDFSFDGKKVLLKNALNLLKNNDYQLLVFAGDAGREGLAIMYRIYHESSCNLPIEYIWKGDTSKDEIRKLWINRLKGTDKLISGEIIDGLTESANFRAIADWKIGMNFSQLYTLYNKLLNDEFINFRIGRVITPTLNMIAYREEQINSFIPKKFYKIKVNYIEGFTGYLYHDLTDNNGYRFYNYNEIVNINSLLLNHKTGEIVSIEKQDISTKPSFGLNGSNIKLSKILKITPKKVLEFIEVMYSIDGVMSYPRVESTYITSGEFENIKSTILFLSNNIDKIPFIYRDVINYIINNNFKTTIAIVDNSKIIEGHGALHIKISKGHLSKEKILYLINSDDNKSIIFKKILNNNLQFFLPESIKTLLTVKISINSNIFLTQNTFLSTLGYKVLDDEKVGSGPIYFDNLKNGDLVNVINYEIENSSTKPPNRINTDSILVYMSHPKKLFDCISKDEEDLYNIIEKSEGIGQPATRQSIIENMINEKYVYIKNGDFYVSEIGYKILNTIDPKIKDVLFTAQLEKGLNDIAFINDSNSKQVLNTFIDKYIKYIINKKIDDNIIEQYNEKFNKKKVLIDKKSPQGFNLYLKENKNKKRTFYVTSDDNKGEDGYPIFYSLYDPIKNQFITNTYCNTNQLCPTCNSKMNVFKSEKNNKYYIECFNRKGGTCSFFGLYDINSDSIINNFGDYLDIKCELCESKLVLIKSNKNGKFYAVCEKNTKKFDDKCNFIKEYDRNKNTFMLPKYMDGAKSSGLFFDGKELFENDKTLFTLDGDITFWKNIGGIEINLSIFKELLEEGLTKGVINGFISKSGNKFNAKLKLEGKMIRYAF